MDQNGQSKFFFLLLLFVRCNNSPITIRSVLKLREGVPLSHSLSLSLCLCGKEGEREREGAESIASLLFTDVDYV